MKDARLIAEEKVNLEALKGMTRAYAEIASRRMVRVRESVLRSRDFLVAIRDVFEDVRHSYKQKVEALRKRRRGKSGAQITFLAHNGKTVAAFLSANTGLYGEIVPKTFNLFLEEVKKRQAEATLIGKMGLSMFLGTGLDLPYTYFDLPDYGEDPGKLKEIVRHLVQYDRVLVYHGRYKSVVTQEPEVFDVSAQTGYQTAAEEAKSRAKKKRRKYYFEPSLEEILMFFESQMFASLFDQTVRESQLAKFASRMLSMDKAEMNIAERLKKVEIEMLRTKHAKANRKQQDMLASVNLW